MATEVFHLLNRGVEGREIFLDSSDYARFVHNMYEFNDAAPSSTFFYRSNKAERQIGLRKSNIVKIHGWCLMRNHYHLLVSENAENGLTLFLRKLNIGYAKYFNEKYERVGTLFQGRTKKVHISQEAQFLYILHYIHLNPLDYLEGSAQWRLRSKGALPSARKALEYLQTYRWSSLPDYLGQKNFPSILTTTLFDNAESPYAEALREFLQDTEAAHDPLFALE